MPRIAFIGAGSVIFAQHLLGDILSFPELQESEIALMDIDPERLRIGEIMARKVGEAVGAKPKITAHEMVSGAGFRVSGAGIPVP